MTSNSEKVPSIVNDLMDLKYFELVDVVSSLSEILKSKGIDPFPAPTAAPVTHSSNANDKAESDVKTEFNIIIESVGDKKLQVIKEVRAITGLGLKEAKELVESAPNAVIKESIPEEEGKELKQKLEGVGAKVV